MLEVERLKLPLAEARREQYGLCHEPAGAQADRGGPWVKTVAGWRKTRHRGLARVGWQFTLALAAYNLIRLPKLLAPA